MRLEASEELHANDANMIKGEMKMPYTPPGATKEMVEELLKEDEEIVRCKDCKHWWKENELCTHENTMHGNVCCLVAKADFFCGYGEMRT